jgi:hypothetical protein
MGLQAPAWYAYVQMLEKQHRVADEISVRQLA